MNLTLATCALGALGLTPVLFDSHGDPQGPPAPIRVSTPLAVVPPVAPAAPVRLFVSGLANQSGTQDLERDAEKLQDEIKRLRNELKALQKVMRKSRSASATLERQNAKANAEALRELSEDPRRIIEQERERMEEQHETARGKLARLAEEAREGASALKETHALSSKLTQQARALAQEQAKEQTHNLNPRIVFAKPHDGKTFAWSYDEDGDHDIRVFHWDDTKGGQQTGIMKTVTGGKNAQVFRVEPGEKLRSSGTGGKIEVGGPNTFHINVEDGDVHIHTSGPSSITTTTTKSTSKASGRSVGDGAGKSRASKDLFDALQGDSHEDVHLFAKVIAKDGEEPTFEVNLNGQDIDIDGIISAVGSDLGELALQGILGEIDGLEGFRVLDADFDFDFEDIVSLKGLENLKGLEQAIERLEESGEFDLDFDFDFDADDCDETEGEDDLDAEDSDGSRDERFVARRMPQRKGHARSFKFVSAAPPAKLAFPTQFRLAGGKTAAASPAPEEELLKLARDIQADVEAMRAELNELREEVRSAPRRR